jgi:hypothetical protein
MKKEGGKMTRSSDDKPFAEEGYALMAAAFEVHNG